MTLGEKQRLFTRLVTKLLQFALENDYEITLGDAYRDPRATFPYSHPKSAHKNRLAIDLNLFKNGSFLETTEGHRQLGEYWEDLHELCRWGGRFGNSDGNHYSIEHEGVN